MRTALGFWDTNVSLNLGQTTIPSDSQKKKKKKKKKRTCRVVDFAVPADDRVKLQGSEKNKYLDLARELKKLWSKKVMVIPIVIGALGKVTEGTGGLGNKWTSQDHPNYNFIKIG